VKNDSNFGFARGYNEALKYIDAEIYALVNSDIEVTENWLLPITQTFEKSPTLRLSTKILDFKINSILNMPTAGGFIDKYGYPYCRGRILTL
jgi:GT2 family glycosyltransferase